MTQNRPITLLSSGLVVALGAAAVAACGGTSAATAPTTASATAKTVSIANTTLGQILVGSHGRTVYLFKADSGTKSACSNSCATAWPPLLAHGTPTAGGGAAASLVGTAKRSDGAQQVTYNGHPLYLFVKDQSAGEVKGQGVSAFGAPWYVLSSAGSQITRRPSSSGASANSRGGGGY
jgi:predicted lipoprotein with Yx(FWY)xxD motif